MDTIRINITGGILHTHQLKAITEICLQHELNHMMLGSRQEIYLHVPNNQLTSQIALQLKDKKLTFEIDNELFPNIVTSYASQDIFKNTSWLKEGIYLEILDSILFKPRLKINIIDGQQTLFPFFTGHLNFIASELTHYWFLYLRLPKQHHVNLWPRLVYSTGISSLSRALDEIIKTNRIRDFQSVVKLGEENAVYLGKEHQYSNENLPIFELPHYEGFHPMAENMWLGIYVRNNLFRTDFMHDLALLCEEIEKPVICLTPWKSLLIKRITPEQQKLIQSLFNRYGINITHAGSELCWIVEDNNRQAEEIKQTIVNHLYIHDINTAGLIFGIRFNKTFKLPANVIIEKDNDIHFSIYYTDNFNPYSSNIIRYEDKVNESELPSVLERLCQFYHKNNKPHEKISHTIDKQVPKFQHTLQQKGHIVYQCQTCATVYDPLLGDPRRNIPAGTPFETIHNFTCYVCDATQSNFKPVEIQQLHAV